MKYKHISKLFITINIFCFFIIISTTSCSCSQETDNTISSNDKSDEKKIDDFEDTPKNEIPINTTPVTSENQQPVIESIQPSYTIANQLLFKLLNFKKGKGKPLTINDFHRQYIYSIPHESIEMLNNEILKKKFVEIDTINKLKKWIESLFPKNHALLIFNFSNNEDTWKNNITQKKSEYLSIYGFEINDKTSEIVFFEWINDITTIMTFTFLPSSELWRERSEYIMESLITIGDYFLENHPHAEFHWISLVEEKPDGHFLHGQLNQSHFLQVLNHWTRSKRVKNLAIIDTGHNSKKSSFTDLDNFCSYSDFVISSDIARFHPTHNVTAEDFNPVNRIHEIDSQDLTEIFSSIMDFYQNSMNINREKLILESVPQSIYLYDCINFLKFRRHFLARVKPFSTETGRDNLSAFDINTDTKQYLLDNFTSEDNPLIDHFNRIYVKKYDNKEDFTWGVNKNGMSMPNTEIININ